MKKWFKRIGIGILVLFGVGAGGFFMANESLPSGEKGAKADSLARKMMVAINDEAWQNTLAISWDFGGRRQLLWDRNRHFTKVTWDENEVLVNINTQTGIVEKKKYNNTKSDEELIREAWEIWVNDSFWLNPVSKAFDPGTSRQYIKTSEGDDALLVSYASGGATPGDAYMWIVDENGIPKAWKLWVSIVPFGGFRFSWDKWITLPTGVKVSTFHHSSLFDLKLSNIKAATTLEALLGPEDPFAKLGQGKAAEKEEETPEPENTEEKEAEEKPEIETEE